MMHPVAFQPPQVFQPVRGQARYGNAQWPVMITGIELTGWAVTPHGPVPFQRARLNPADTYLSGQCHCPMHWQTFPVRQTP